MAKKKSKDELSDLIGKAIEQDKGHEPGTIEQEKKSSGKMGRPAAFPPGESVRVTYRIHESTDKALRRALIDSEHQSLSELVNAAIRSYLGLPEQTGE